MKFKDHFSAHAAAYARHRPRYPPALFEYLAAAAPNRGAAWDCATGNGQAAVALADQFQRVLATDASAAQIENAEPHRRIEYRVAPAESSGIEPHSIALITVAQALHWFDLPLFFAEAQRVLQPGGIIACWGYNLLTIAPEIDPLVNRFYRETTGPFWPAEREMIETGYGTIEFPFDEITPPPFEMRALWNLDQLLGYLRTWSATQKFISARGFDPVDSLSEALGRVWGGADAWRAVRWPLHGRVGRLPEMNLRE